jgi:cellulose synthase operon protein YhjQ
MTVISVVSMKGGVGKTSITANLATALANKLGAQRVSAIDLDPQNALKWHFGFVQHELPGLCSAAVTGSQLAEIGLLNHHGIGCTPYGAATEPERIAFELILKQQPDWLRLQIAKAFPRDDQIVLIDTPPGQSVYLSQAFACSDLVLIVLLADGASYATVPAMETFLEEMIPVNPYLKTLYVINQLDESDPLGKDIFALLRHRLQDRISPLNVSSDEAVREALALQQSVLQYDPHGQANQDFLNLAHWLTQELKQ